MDTKHTLSKPKNLLVLFVVALLSLLAIMPTYALADDSSEKIDIPDGYAQIVDWSRLSGSTRLDTMAEDQLYKVKRFLKKFF